MENLWQTWLSRIHCLFWLLFSLTCSIYTPQKYFKNKNLNVKKYIFYQILSTGDLEVGPLIVFTYAWPADVASVWYSGGFELWIIILKKWGKKLQKSPHFDTPGKKLQKSPIFVPKCFNCHIIGLPKLI